MKHAGEHFLLLSQIYFGNAFFRSLQTSALLTHVAGRAHSQLRSNPALPNRCLLPDRFGDREVPRPVRRRLVLFWR